MSFKEIINLISERHGDMTEVTDALSDMMHTVKDRLPEVYKETMYCLEEIAYRITPEESRVCAHTVKNGTMIPSRRFWRRRA